MNRESIYKSFLEDPLLMEKGYLTPEKIETLRFMDPTGVKLLEVIKLAINGIKDEESENIIARKINQYLNK